jgi:hypothetical protein
MANGNPLSVTILASGIEAEIEFESDGAMGLNGTYLFDTAGGVSTFDAKPVLTSWASAKIVFTVTSESYDDLGALTTAVRTVRGTRARMKAYPNNATAEERLNGTNVIVTITLDEPIYNDDKNGGAGTSGVNPTVTLLSGVYTQNSIASTSVSGFAVTNNSTLDYPKTFGRFASIPFENITGPFNVEALCVNFFAREGRPCRVVKFVASDGTNTETVLVTAMTKSSYDDTPLYVATFNTGDFTAASVLTVDITAYPWFGDADSVFDTTGIPMPSLSPTSLTLLCEYPITYASVDWNSDILGSLTSGVFVDRESLTQAGSSATAIAVGSGVIGSGGVLQVCEVSTSPAPTSTGVWTGVTSGATFTPTSVPTAKGSDTTGAAASTEAAALLTPCRSTRAAINKIKTYNNTNYARNNADGGHVVIKAGDGPCGADVTTTAGTTTSGAVTILPATGVLKSEVRFKRVGTADNSNGVNHIIFKSVIAKSSSANLTVLRGALYGLFDDVEMQGHSRSASNHMLRAFQYYWFKGCSITTSPHGYGLHGGASPNHAILVRNCTGTDLDTAFLRESLWNINVTFTDTATGSPPDYVDFVTEREDTCVYRAYGWKCRGTFWSGQSNRRLIANVMWEYVGDSTTKAFGQFSDANITDALFWHNTGAGQRWNVLQNTAPNNTITGFSSKFSAHYYNAHKHDVFASDGTLIGWWWTMYGVGCMGVVSIKDTFPPAYGGINFDDNVSYASIWEDAQFNSGDTPDPNGAGDGDYTPVEDGPLADKIPAGFAVLPYDINGVVIPNDGTGYAGAIAFGTAIILPPDISYTSPQVLIQNVFASITPTNLGDAIPPGGWVVTTGTLPTGLTINADTGVISGTPTVQGTSQVTITATNTAGFDTAVIDFDIDPPAIPAPNISYTTPQNLTEDTPVSPINPTNTGGAVPVGGYTINAGSLPTGLALDADTGSITGTPTLNGTYQATIRATNSGGSDDFVIDFNVALALPNITYSTPQVITVNSAYSTDPTNIGGDIPNAGWSVLSGSLPTGLILNVDTGTISGTPTVQGDFTPTIRATNATGSDDFAIEFTVSATYTPPVLVEGTGWLGSTTNPGQIGSGPGATSIAIARWNVVQWLTIDSSLRIGLMAFHRNKIERVEFSIDDGPWATVYEPTINPVTNVPEYEVVIDPATMSDAFREIRAIVYPVIGTTRTLQGAVPVQNGAHDETGLWITTNNSGTFDNVIIYCDIVNGNDTTGTGSSGNPYKTIQKAQQSVPQIANASTPTGAADNSTIRLRAGTYAGGYSGTTKPNTLNGWMTIEADAASGATKANVIIDTVVNATRTRLTRWRDVHFKLGQPNNWSIASISASNQSLWLDDCKIEGAFEPSAQAVPGNSVISSSGNWRQVYVTDSEIFNCSEGYNGYHLVRDSSAHHLVSDAFSNCRMVVKSDAFSNRGFGSGVHPDVYQISGPSTHIRRNCILYGVRSWDIPHQGLFHDDIQKVEDFAAVNCQFARPWGDALPSGGERCQFLIPAEHYVIWYCTFAHYEFTFGQLFWGNATNISMRRCHAGYPVIGGTWATALTALNALDIGDLTWEITNPSGANPGSPSDTIGDPLFLDPVMYNFHPDPTSELVGRVIGTGTPLWPYDYDNVIRGVPDTIGAYYVASATSGTQLSIVLVAVNGTAVFLTTGG